MPLTNFPNGITSFGAPVMGAGMMDASGTVFFVDGNSGSDASQGKSWDKPFRTLKVAFAASHADIARGSDRWARRNTIFCAGDAFVEDIDALPQKTDVIGVGSFGGNQYARVQGDHAPVNSATGCRFINMGFEPATATVMWTMVLSNWGTNFLGCHFYYSQAAINAVTAIDITASSHMRIMGCDFMGAFSGEVIEFAAGDAGNTRVCDNYLIGGAAEGINMSGNPNTTSGKMLGLIDNNVIQCATKVIDDNTNVSFMISNNTCLSGASHNDAEDITTTMAVNNIVTDGAGLTKTIPLLITGST